MNCALHNLSMDSGVPPMLCSRVRRDSLLIGERRRAMSTQIHYFDLLLNFIFNN